MLAVNPRPLYLPTKCLPESHTHLYTLFKLFKKYLSPLAQARRPSYQELGEVIETAALQWSWAPGCSEACWLPPSEQWQNKDRWYPAVTTDPWEVKEHLTRARRLDERREQHGRD